MAEGQGSGGLTVPDAEAKGRTLLSQLFPREESGRLDSPGAGSLLLLSPGRMRGAPRFAFPMGFGCSCCPHVTNSPLELALLGCAWAGSLSSVPALWRGWQAVPERNANPGDLCDLPHPSPTPVMLPNFCQALLERGTQQLPVWRDLGQSPLSSCPAWAPQPLGDGKVRIQMQALVWERRKGMGREAQPWHGWGCTCPSLALAGAGPRACAGGSSGSVSS